MSIHDYHYMEFKDGSHSLYYGDLTDYDESELEDVQREIPESDWTAEVWCEICGNILEDANRHSMTEIASDYLNSLRNANLDESTILTCIRLFVEVIYQTI